MTSTSKKLNIGIDMVVEEGQERGPAWTDQPTDSRTQGGQLTGARSFGRGAQLSHVHRAVLQVLAAVLHLSSSPLTPSTCFFNSSPTSSTERQGPVRLATQGDCQRDSDPLASLSLCLTRRSGGIKAAFWKLIWKGGTSGGGGLERQGERERWWERGRDREE